MSLPRNKKRDVKQDIVMNTQAKCVDHPLYKAGFHIPSYGHAINPQLVLQVPDREVAGLADKMFKFDTTVVPKSKETMLPFKVCTQLHGGLCRNDELCIRADMGSRNVHTLVRLNELKAPIPFKLDIQFHKMTSPKCNVSTKQTNQLRSCPSHFNQFDKTTNTFQQAMFRFALFR